MRSRWSRFHATIAPGPLNRARSSDLSEDGLGAQPSEMTAMLSHENESNVSVSARAIRKVVTITTSTNQRNTSGTNFLWVTVVHGPGVKQRAIEFSERTMT